MRRNVQMWQTSVSRCTSGWGCWKAFGWSDPVQPEFRVRAVAVPDYFVDVPYEGEIVRARYRDGKLLLHKGGDRFLEVPGGEFGPKQISPTRDTRFRWMQSVIRCTHYVAGASEQHYINKADDPTVKFIERVEISDSGKAYTDA